MEDIWVQIFLEISPLVILGCGVYIGILVTSLIQCYRAGPIDVEVKE